MIVSRRPDCHPGSFAVASIRGAGLKPSKMPGVTPYAY